MSDILTYLTGFEVGPTTTDYINATMYASDVTNKEVCESRPDLYTWVPSTITRYPCPEGLTCSTGVCKFREDACREMSELPYYDCVRKEVPCNTTPSGVCKICDYSIRTGHNIVGPFIDGNGAPDGCWAGDEIYESYIPYPVPIYAPRNNVDDDICTSDASCMDGATCVLDEDDAHLGACVVPCTTITDCASFNDAAVCGSAVHGASLDGRCFVPTPIADAAACPRQARDPDPYTVPMYDTSDEAVAHAKSYPDDPLRTVTAQVPCVMDEDCAIPPGVGGVCGRDPNGAAYGFCYNPYPSPYLEWRDEIRVWDGMPPSRNVCVETMPYSRQWCEMPWTRPGANPNNPTVPLPQRVKDAWKTKARPPFWYDDRDGSCHVTKTYCEANLKNGGFSAGYGNSTNFWISSTCNTGGTQNEVKDGYDCCTKLGDSIGEFFLGRTLTTNFRELVEGDAEGFNERWGEYLNRADPGISDAFDHVSSGADVISNADGSDVFNTALRQEDPGLADLVDFVSDPRLKRNIEMIAMHVLDAHIDVHAYRWTWDAVATSLYGVRGPAQGLLASELRDVAPHLVHRDDAGYDHVVVPRNSDIHMKMICLGATPRA